MITSISQKGPNIKTSSFSLFNKNMLIKAFYLEYVQVKSMRGVSGIGAQEGSTFFQEIIELSTFVSCIAAFIST